MGRALGNNISEGAKKARLSRGRSGFNAVTEALANLVRAELHDPAVVPVGARRHTLYPLALTSHCDAEYFYKGGMALGRVALFKNNHWEGKVSCNCQLLVVPAAGRVNALVLKSGVGVTRQIRVV